MGIDGSSSAGRAGDNALSSQGDLVARIAQLGAAGGGGIPALEGGAGQGTRAGQGELVRIQDPGLPCGLRRTGSGVGNVVDLIKIGGKGHILGNISRRIALIAGGGKPGTGPVVKPVGTRLCRALGERHCGGAALFHRGGRGGHTGRGGGIGLHRDGVLLVVILGIEGGKLIKNRIGGNSHPIASGGGVIPAPEGSAGFGGSSRDGVQLMTGLIHYFNNVGGGTTPVTTVGVESDFRDRNAIQNINGNGDNCVSH